MHICLFAQTIEQMGWKNHKGNHEYYVILLQLKEVDSLSFFKDVKENRTKSAIYGMLIITDQKYVSS